MKSDACLFAHSAAIGQNGLISLLNAGVQWINMPRFPAAIRNLVFAVHLVLEPEECDKTMNCVCKVTAPDGRFLIPDVALTVMSPKNAGNPDKPSGFFAVFQYDWLTFQVPGEYAFRVSTDGQILAYTTLQLNEVRQ